MMNFINSNAAGIRKDGLGADAGFNWFCSLHFHSICKVSAADWALLCKVLHKHPQGYP